MQYRRKNGDEVIFWDVKALGRWVCIEDAIASLPAAPRSLRRAGDSLSQTSLFRTDEC
ncbi:MAG: hypothetical protein SAJ72_22000 [Jaaginema sp. PMC 1080.18]|nr:hypothetical protein [Jaaginema sp. PMC 1080.18]